jgi:hypothetical protein
MAVVATVVMAIAVLVTGHCHDQPKRKPHHVLHVAKAKGSIFLPNKI